MAKILRERGTTLDDVCAREFFALIPEAIRRAGEDEKV